MADWEQTAPSVCALGDVSFKFLVLLWFEMMKSVCGLSSVETLKGMELNDLTVSLLALTFQIHTSNEGL